MGETGGTCLVETLSALLAVAVVSDFSERERDLVEDAPVAVEGVAVPEVLFAAAAAASFASVLAAAMRREFFCSACSSSLVKSFVLE